MSVQNVRSRAGLNWWAKTAGHRWQFFLVLLALLFVIVFQIKVWNVGALFSLDALHSFDIVPAPNTMEYLHLWILGDVTTYHSIQVFISAVEWGMMPYHITWMKVAGFVYRPVFTRRTEIPSWMAFIWWVAMTCDIGMSFGGVALWILAQTQPIPLFGGIALPHTPGFSLMVLSLLASLIIGFMPEQLGRPAVMYFVEMIKTGEWPNQPVTP